MKKLTKVVLMFDDGSEASMESAKEINMNIKTELLEPMLVRDGDKIVVQYLPPDQRTYTTVVIDFVLSRVAIDGDKELAEFIKTASAK